MKTKGHFEIQRELANTELRRCTACHSVWYCSTDCQQAHWHAHQPQCKGCGHCQKKGEGLRRCAACHRILYCSAECQHADWAAHKPACRRAMRAERAAAAAALCAAAAAAPGTEFDQYDKDTSGGLDAAEFAKRMTDEGYHASIKRDGAGHG